MGTFINTHVHTEACSLGPLFNLSLSVRWWTVQLWVGKSRNFMVLELLVWGAEHEKVSQLAQEVVKRSDISVISLFLLLWHLGGNQSP